MGPSANNERCPACCHSPPGSFRCAGDYRIFLQEIGQVDLQSDGEKSDAGELLLQAYGRTGWRRFVSRSAQ